MTKEPPGLDALPAAIPPLAGHELAAVLDHVADGVTVQDLNGRLRYANAAAARALGFPSPAALVATPPAEVMARFALFDEAGSPFPSDRLPGRRALRGERPPPATVRFRLAATGEERWAVVSATPILDGAGRVAAVVNVFRDATERRRAAEATARLAAIVEGSDDAIVARTLDGTITDWNPGAERLYGYTAAEAVGQHVAFLVPPGQAAELAERNARLARGERVPPIETVRLRKDGALVDVSIGLAPIRGAAGRVVGAATIARDVTDRRRAEVGQRVLAEAGAVLVAETEVGAMLAALARLAVPRLAARCPVHLATDDGAVARVAVEPVRPERDPDDPAVRTVLRTGQPELAADLAASAMVVPLAARGRTFGALTFVAASGRRYDTADLALARELAGRAALAVDNTRLLGEARAAEARIRGLFAGVADAILVANEAGRYLDANPAAAALLRYDREELLRLGVADVVAVARRARAAGGRAAAAGRAGAGRPRPALAVNLHQGGSPTAAAARRGPAGDDRGDLDQRGTDGTANRGTWPTRCGWRRDRCRCGARRSTWWPSSASGRRRRRRASPPTRFGWKCRRRRWSATGTGAGSARWCRTSSTTR